MMTDNNEIISAYDSKQTQAPVNGEQLAAQASQTNMADQQGSQNQMQASTSESSPPNHSSMPDGRTSEQTSTSGGLAGASDGTKTMGFEDALDYTVNQSTDSSLKPGDKRTVNYLVHRMIWDQQEKIDIDDRAISKDGTMEVQDSFDVEQSGLK
ncbi:hypothetical protein [Anaerospora sp.]|jgi:hypothetical protein|uniref:hypothetical protein n=1 Tax=Anaerospora sp. TaxID=1960278 RepID=UPI00289EE316|nr:hypothetical protein [Anaerospora sp.]